MALATDTLPEIVKVSVSKTGESIWAFIWFKSLEIAPNKS